MVLDKPTFLKNLTQYTLENITTTLYLIKMAVLNKKFVVAIKTCQTC